MKLWIYFAATAAFVGMATEASAQDRFTFDYRGTVTSSPRDGAERADGQPWSTTGIPLPAYATETGDAFTLSLSGLLPNLSALAPDADGLVRMRVSGDSGVSNPPNTALIDLVNFSFGMGSSIVPGLFGADGLNITYNPLTEAFGLEVAHGGYVNLGTFNLPVYNLTEDENSVRTATLGNAPNVQNRLGWSNAHGGADYLNFGGTAISFGTPNTYNGRTGPLNTRGNWGNLSVSRGSSGSTDVPAPPVILLFGAGAAALIARRKAKAA